MCSCSEPTFEKITEFDISDTNGKRIVEIIGVMDYPSDAKDFVQDIREYQNLNKHDSTYFTTTRYFVITDGYTLSYNTMQDLDNRDFLAELHILDRQQEKSKISLLIYSYEGQYYEGQYYEDNYWD